MIKDDCMQRSWKNEFDAGELVIVIICNKKDDN